MLKKNQIACRISRLNWEMHIIGTPLEAVMWLGFAIFASMQWKSKWELAYDMIQKLTAQNKLQMYCQISPHCLCILPWCENSGFTLWSACIYMCCLIMLSLSNSIFNVHIQPGQCFMHSPLFLVTARIRNLRHFVSIFSLQFFRVLKLKINLVKLTFRTAISSNQVMGVI